MERSSGQGITRNTRRGTTENGILSGNRVELDFRVYTVSSNWLCTHTTVAAG